MRFCREISRRRRNFFRSAAMDAWIAAIETRRDLAGALPGTKDPSADQDRIDNFQRQLRAHGLAGRYCLLYQNPASDAHDLSDMRCIGMSKRALLDRLAGPNTLLNLSYSIHPPFLLQFEQRIFCDLDPSEIFYWMTKMEMGQSYHHEFWTIGLNVHGHDCRLPKSSLKLENILSAGGHETSLPPAASAPGQIHDDRTMVLGRSGGGRRCVSRSFKKICVRALPRSSETDSRGAF